MTSKAGFPLSKFCMWGGGRAAPLGPPWTLALMGGPAPLLDRPAQAGGGAGLSRRGGQGGRPVSEVISKKKKKVDEVLKYNFPPKFGVITMICIEIVGGAGLPRRGAYRGGLLKI